MRLAEVDPDVSNKLDSVDEGEVVSEGAESSSFGKKEGDTLGIIAGYLKEIQTLKTELSANEAALNQFKRNQTSSASKYSNAQIFEDFESSSASVVEGMDNLTLNNGQVEESNLSDSVTKYVPNCIIYILNKLIF